ncbi:MAG: hypothetical protein ACC628_15915 [Pirellulaceae bacterium]
MNAYRISPCILLSLSLAFPLHADDESESSRIAADLQRAKARVAGKETFKLRYQFAPGEIVRWKVVHLATTETQVQGNTQSARSRATSTKVWKVTQVNDDGSMTLSHSVDHVDMWQKLTDRPESRYNSETDKKAPPEYQHVAKTLSRPLTSITIRPDGTILNRESALPDFKFGVGNMVMRLPPQAIPIGSRWFEPSEIRVRMPDSRFKRIKTRKLYTLEKVQTGIADISVKTEVLTPVNDPKVKAGLIQQLTEGEIKFDVDAGRVISKQMDWDETVVGFDGADGMLKYLARLTEALLPPEASTAQRKSDDDPPTADNSQPVARAARAKTPLGENGRKKEGKK